MIGAVYRDGTHFRVWAPKSTQVTLLLAGNRYPMSPKEDGYYELFLPEAQPGMDYLYELDGDKQLPDPASRWQPNGVHGASRILNPQAHHWQDKGWTAPPQASWIIYELHIGTFTTEGTFYSAIEKIPHLAALGITTIEVMPVSSFPGTRNWGYDGVYPFAPQENYGGPTGFKAFIDACHQAGLAVVLDVVYNHFGPEGAYFHHYGYYYTDAYHTPWGCAINYDGPYCGPVRDYVLDNVRYWIEDYHLDGLRLDAVQEIYDMGAKHILQEIQAAVPDNFIVAESNLNDVRLLTEYGLKAQWNDDFHHALHVILTGDKESYFADYGSIADVAKSYSDGFVYDGRYSYFRKKRYGNSSRALPGDCLVAFNQNHDQIANASHGLRLSVLTSKERQRLAALLLVCAPSIPMLFMGEEWGADTRFDYFTDFIDPALAREVTKGRKREYPFDFSDPQELETFLQSKLNWQIDPEMLQFYRELITLRKATPALNNGRKDLLRTEYDENGLFVMERRDAEGAAVWLIANLSDHECDPHLPQGHKLLQVGEYPGAPWSGALLIN